MDYIKKRDICEGLVVLTGLLR